jgi:P-type Cu2+ transporter
MTEAEEERSYTCSECGLHYTDKAKAEKCEIWCSEYKSCNLEIIAHALENKALKRGNHMAREKTIYMCPMHPEVQQGHEGLCPECGMQLVSAKEKPPTHEARDGFNKHQGHKTNIFKVKFWVSLVLSMPVVLYSDITQTLLHWRAPQFFGSDYLPLVLGSVIFWYGGLVFLTSAYRELRAKKPGMMTLISLAIVTAYVYSVSVVFFNTLGRDLFWELATLITIMLLGHWMEMRAVTGAQGALKELARLLPDTAQVMRGGKTEIVPLIQVKTADIVLVKPGARIPTDGEVLEGSSEVDESVVTGESSPVGKEIGAAVIAGTTNGDGSLQIKVTKIGDETFLSGVMRLVAEAQASKSKLQLLSDRAAFYLTVVAVVAGGVTLAVWLAAADVAFAIERLVAVLVIACPHALGLAIPLVASISTTKAANNGFLIKQRLALEAARHVDTVLFDKTGTLTRGEFGIDIVIPAAHKTQQDVLQLAASVNSYSEHPIAKAIVKQAQREDIKLFEVKNFQRLAGKGAQADINNQTVSVGSPQLMEDFGVKIVDQRDKLDELSEQGKTVIFVIKEKELIGIIALADVIREESRQAVHQLHELGVKTVMITGDNAKVARWVASELKLDEYFAEVLPGDKAAKVKLLQMRGQIVAMVGDGVNDAPALTQADLGIAIGAGTNIAIESAGIILVKDDPRDIVKIIRLSKLTYAKMIQNLWWAAGYNIVAIPLAAGVLAFKGIFLQPALAALLMSLSTVIVAFNAVLLKRKQLA